jgi:hypothetical protein
MGLYTDQSYVLKQVCYNCHHGSHQKCKGSRYFRKNEEGSGKTICECDTCKTINIHRERGI